MRVPRIYTEQSLAEYLDTPNREFELEEDASHHLLKVLRMDIGRKLILFNGQSHEDTVCEYSAHIIGRTKKCAVIHISGRTHVAVESPLSTHLAIGISRGERFDWIVQKATELGITSITPLFTERTEVKLNAERLQKKLHSWKKIMIGACEQSGRCVLPTLHACENYGDFITTHNNELKLVLHHRSDTAVTDHPRPTSTTLLIGPEGGLSENEIHSALTTGYNALTLGPRILRTETAPIAALAILQQCWGDI